MTFEEKLDRAKVGSKAAYESLCLACIDSLYTAALIALKNDHAASGAVSSAISDGYTGISRIRDERHLRSWLVHELTKNVVDKLKAFKAEGVTHTASGTFADTGRLPDVERLILAISVCFGYSVREISILTGMAEGTVSDKLASAKEHLGANLDSVSAKAASYQAPEALKEKYRAFDESVARLQRTAVLSEIPVVQAPDISQPTVVEAPEPVQMPVVQETVAMEPVRPAEATAAKPAEADTVEIPPLALETESGDEDIFVEETSGEDEEGEDGESEEQPVYAEESVPVQETEGSEEKAFDAETFIAVVSAEKMKGSEFLRLIGNTRISNSVYREIESNPHLSKKRLVELLEQSPLTEADYYKMLTAIKHRREMLNAKEENRLALERAGLFDGTRRGRYKRKPKEAPKTEMQMAIGLDRQTPAESGDPAVRETGIPFDDTSVRAVHISEVHSEPQQRVGYRPDVTAPIPVSVETAEDDDGGAFTPVLSEDMFDEYGNTAEIPIIDENMREKYDDGSPAAPDIPAKPELKVLTAVPVSAESEEPSAPEAENGIAEEAAETGAVQELTEEVTETTEKEAGGENTEEPETPAEETHKAEFTETAEIKPVAGLSDTRPFEKRFDMLEQEAAAKGSEEHGDGDSITTDPLAKMTVTQIIEGVEAENDDDGFVPDVDVSFDDTGEIPVVRQQEEEEAEDAVGNDGGEDDEAGGRPRYKGEEYFYDDSKYHEGDNRGKIIFCIVCALLLAAGAALLYFVLPKNGGGESAETTVTGQTGTADEAAESTAAEVEKEAPKEEVFSEEAAFRAAASLDEFGGSGRSDGSAERYIWDMQYMRASDEPYNKLFTRTISVNDGMAYVFVGEITGNGTLYAVPLDSEDHKPVGSVELYGEESHGFAAVGDKVYVWRPQGTGAETYITVMSRDLGTVSTYTVLAGFTDVGMVDGKLIFVGNYTPRIGEMAGVTVPYYNSSFIEETRHDIAAEDVSVIEGAKFAASTVLFEPESGTFTAIVGGYGTYAQFTDSGITLLIPDDGCTYIAETGKDLRPKSIKRMKGEAFAPECYYGGGLVGLQYTDTEHGVTAYKGGKTLTTQEMPDDEPKEVARAIALSGDTVYVRTLKYENSNTEKSYDMLYGFDMSGDEPVSAKIEADDIYSEKLIKAGKYLAGVTGEPGEDGERAGLRLSLYRYDGALTEAAHTVIELDEETPRENLKYIKSDAETDPAQLAVNEDGTMFAVPTEYFDGFSAVRRVVTLTFDSSDFTQTGDIQLYDVKQTVPFISDDKLYIFTDKEIITEDGKVPYTE